MMKRFLLVTALALAASACSTTTVPEECRSIVIAEETLSKDALIQRVGVAEAERQYLDDGVPFGERNAEWEALKESMESGDQLWFYRDNRTIVGAEGFVVVRNCEVVGFFITTKY